MRPDEGVVPAAVAEDAPRDAESEGGEGGLRGRAEEGEQLVPRGAACTAAGENTALPPRPRMAAAPGAAESSSAAGCGARCLARRSASAVCPSRAVAASAAAAAMTRGL